MTTAKDFENDLKEIEKIVALLNQRDNLFHTISVCVPRKRIAIASRMTTKQGKRVCSYMLEHLGAMASRIQELEAENARFEQTTFGLRDDMHALTDVILGMNNEEGTIGDESL